MTPLAVSPSARAANVSAMRCLRIGSAVSMTSSIDGDSGDGDGPMFDANLASCLAGGTGALLYGTAFTSGNLQWTEPIGDWGVTLGEAIQTDQSLALAYAYPDQTANETDYRLAAKIRNRRKRQTADESGPSAWSRLTARLSRITLGQIMLAGLACLILAFFLRDSSFGMWLTIAGLAMTIGAFVLSVIRGSGTTGTVSGKVQRRWRGQVIEYSEPSTSTMDRFRAWLRRRGRH